MSGFLFLLPLALLADIPDNIVIGTFSRAVDGDTFYMDSEPVRVRVWGIDAPECSPKPCLHDPATQKLVKIVKDKPLTCIHISTSYERKVVRCILPNGKDVSHEMLKSGLVEEACKYSKGEYGHCG